VRSVSVRQRLLPHVVDSRVAKRLDACCVLSPRVRTLFDDVSTECTSAEGARPGSQCGSDCPPGVLPRSLPPVFSQPLSAVTSPVCSGGCQSSLPQKLVRTRWPLLWTVSALVEEHVGGVCDPKAVTTRARSVCSIPQPFSATFGPRVCGVVHRDEVSSAVASAFAPALSATSLVCARELIRQRFQRTFRPRALSAHVSQGRFHSVR